MRFSSSAASSSRRAALRVQGREALEHVLVGEIERRRLLEARDAAIRVLDIVEPDPRGVVPGEELVGGDEARPRERLGGLGRPATIPGALARLPEETPRDDVAGIFFGRALEEPARQIQVVLPHRRLPGAEVQRGELVGPVRLRDERERRHHDLRFVFARARVRVGEAKRPQRRLALRGGELRHLARRVPAPFAEHAHACRELRVRRALAAGAAGERARDRRGDRLELVVAPVGHVRVLDVAEARLVQRIELEDRAVPEDRAGGIAAADRVEIGEPLVRLAALAIVLGRARAGQELVGEARRFAPLDLGALERQPTEPLVAARTRGLRRPQARLLVAGALVFVRRLGEEERLRGPDRRLRALLAPGAAIGGRIDREPLVELAQRDVLGARLVRLGEPLGGDVRLGVRDEERLAHRVERALERVARLRATLADPTEHVVHVPRAARRALGEERREREKRRRLVDRLEPRRERRIVLVRAPRDRLEPQERRAHRLGDRGAERLEERRGVRPRIELQERAHRRLARGIGGERRAVRIGGALALPGALGDERGGELPVARRGRVAGVRPARELRAHVLELPGARRELERDRARPFFALRRAHGGLDVLVGGVGPEQPAERDHPARALAPGGVLRARAQILGGGRQPDRRDGRRQRRHPVGRRDRVELGVALWERQAHQRRERRALVRRERVLVHRRLDQARVADLDAEPRERAPRERVVAAEEPAQPLAGLRARRVAVDAERVREPARRLRELGHAAELGDERRRGRHVPFAQRLARAAQRVAREDLAGVPVRALGAAEAQRRADAERQARERRRLRRAEPGVHVIVPRERAPRARGERARVLRRVPRRLIPPPRRPLVVPRGAQVLGAHEERVQAVRGRLRLARLVVERGHDARHVHPARQERARLPVREGEARIDLARLDRQAGRRVEVAAQRVELARGEERPRPLRGVGHRARLFLEPLRALEQRGLRVVLEQLARGVLVAELRRRRRVLLRLLGRADSTGTRSAGGGGSARRRRSARTCRCAPSRAAAPPRLRASRRDRSARASSAPSRCASSSRSPRRRTSASAANTACPWGGCSASARPRRRGCRRACPRRSSVGRRSSRGARRSRHRRPGSPSH